MTYQKAFNRRIYHNCKTLSRTQPGKQRIEKIHRDKNLFFVPELHRPHGHEFQWSSGADRDRDSPRRRRPPRRDLLRRQEETFCEQVRSGERAERRGEQTAEREQP